VQLLACRPVLDRKAGKGKVPRVTRREARSASDRRSRDETVGLCERPIARGEVTAPFARSPPFCRCKLRDPEPCEQSPGRIASVGRSPCTTSSTLTAHARGMSPAARSAPRRSIAPARPRRRSMRTVVSRRTAPISRLGLDLLCAVPVPSPPRPCPSHGRRQRWSRGPTRSAPSVFRRRARGERPPR
jgi:hypothetical protein